MFFYKTMWTSSFIFILLVGCICRVLDGQNIALGKDTMQISVFNDPNKLSGSKYLESKYAVDGDFRQKMFETTCAHTQCNHPIYWWTVDFGRAYYIDRVVIYGRKDCCEYRLVDFDILVYNPSYASWTNYDNTAGQLCYRQSGVSPTILNATCNKDTVKGRYLKIEKRRKNNSKDDCSALTLCEVQVFGSEVMKTPTEEEPMCPCSCSYKHSRDYWRHRDIPNLTMEEWRQILAPELEKLDRELRVNKTELSTRRRSKISANDNRKSAQRLGILGAVFLSFVIASVVYIDVMSIWKWIKTKRMLRPELHVSI